MRFYKETNFKETPIGKIPKDWEIVRLGNEKVSVHVKSGSTPPKRVEDYWNGNILFVTQSDMTKVNHYLYETSEKITELGLKSSNLLLVPENSILLSMYGTIGKVVINKTPVAVSQNIAAIILNKKNVDEEYLHYAIQKYSFQFKRQAKTITLKHLDIKIVKNMILPLPSISEQQKIVGVLSCVDLAIQKVDEAIARAERLKKGLMQHLLTKGIGHKEYKETLIGKIPKTWKVVELREIAQKFIGGGTPSTKVPRYWNGDIPWIRSVHLTRYYIDESIIDQYITKEGLENSASNIVPKRNLIIATRVGVGKSAVNLIDVAINQDLTGVVIVPSIADPFYLVWYLTSPKVVRMLESFSRGTTIKGVPLNHIKRLKVPLPPLNEQRRITEILSSVDNLLQLKREKREKLVRMKRRLMDLLLTGKVRVIV